MPNYPELETLMSGWFHQDFDLDGNTTLEQIIAAYRDVTPRDQRQALVFEIAHFLSRSEDVEAEFQERFKPDVMPTGFAPTTRQFLERIAALVRV
jgi:hypothetical protein